MGVDLSKFQLISYFPDSNVHLGLEDDSQLLGLTFIISPQHIASNNSFSFSFTLKGEHNVVTDEDIEYQFFANRVDALNVGKTFPICTPIKRTSGPSSASSASSSSSSSSSTVGGFVRIVGLKGGKDRQANIPLTGVIVQLLKLNPDIAGKFDVMGLAMTNELGYYSFSLFLSSSDIISNYAVAVLDDGILRRNEGFNALGTQFIVADVEDKTGAFPYGAPLPASLGDNNIIGLLLDPNATPQYLVPRSDGSFKGRGRSVQFWRRQMDLLHSGGHAALLTVPSRRLSHLETITREFLSTCNLQADMFVGNSNLNAVLVAAVLNREHGYGVFEPYDVIEDFILLWTRHSLCEGGLHSDLVFTHQLILRVMPPELH
jgi:hypothetical protein